MGILNITPDSFYDGGKFLSLEAAKARAAAMLEQGADIIDIGGESSGPTSKDVSLEEELSRVIPVVKAVRNLGASCISIDTRKAEVARTALEHGAHMINDVTAGRGDPDMFSVIATYGCPYVLMRSKDPSVRTTIKDITYDNVLQTIHLFFEERLKEAQNAGISLTQCILDPGLGHFVSSNPAYSWHILEHLEFLQDVHCPILVSPSRKSFTEKTLEGTLRATALALQHGATIIRTHDIAETHAILPCSKQSG